ncbi:hypothetical protein PTSG_02192 [Salpingoeca rosetta]|uniref:Endoplasmic reticulum-based factor for assembly of V-ATPase n=1 Tax=Salpingoeca rosetta (strain ATCC 50818 / BSB-021) TaxID=946362 RepID=F2U1H2_SALR5|nr:uncharacterized protein PTSG_02192 [Salpingoeca rosetta]EGD81474.1 hypothetical protein PTSG_02192 [Salpingoeca rosetta]|eukprot:XP_004996678.1 hypothetical protein PTSG_02192 [Salpingoeca rosetta]
MQTTMGRERYVDEEQAIKLAGEIRHRIQLRPRAFRTTAGTSDEPVLVSVTPAMRDFATKCLECNQRQSSQGDTKPVFCLNIQEQSTLRHITDPSHPKRPDDIMSSAIQYSMLRDLVIRYREAFEKPGGEKAPRMHRLMRRSQIVRQPLIEPEPSPELVERRKKLKAHIANLEYNKMVKDLEPKRDFDTSPMEVREVQRQFTVAINVLATLVACFFFGFYASTYAFEKTGSRVLFGIACAVVAGVAELWFLLRIAMQKEAEAERKAQQEKEQLLSAGSPTATTTTTTTTTATMSDSSSSSFSEGTDASAVSSSSSS